MRKKPTGALRFTLGAAALIAACSLFTPYPADLVRALRGRPAGTPAAHPPNIDVDEDADSAATHASPSGQSEGSSPGHRTGETAISPRPPRPASHTIPAGSVTRWQPPLPGAMPTIELPPFPPVLPLRTSPGNFENISSLTKGLYLKSSVNFIPGTTAAADRLDKRSYTAHFSLDIVLPQAAGGKELTRFNPELPNVLKGFDALMNASTVSPYYHALYLRKQNELRKNAASLAKLLDRHNFYDTDTILEIRPPGGRPLLWLQADMDVVSDGSDGDRLAKMPEAIVKSAHYQPSTSYRWKKRTPTPNPLLAAWEGRLAAAQSARKKAAGTQKKACDDKIDYARRVINELKNYSFLIAEYDPFIVLPLGIVNQRGSDFSPQFGDYALVLAGNKIYPAIVGDAGPRYKTGEASLRLAKAVNAKAGIYSRPVSDLSVSYLVFPGTAEPEKGPIDYDRLHARCRQLLDSIGGSGPGAEFHEWEDLLKPAPSAPAPASAPQTPASPATGTGAAPDAPANPANPANPAAGSATEAAPAPLPRRLSE